MQIKNPQADALKSSLTPHQFGQAMAQLDLQAIPEHKRKAALADHLAKVVAANIHDRQAAANLTAARFLRAKHK